jgi:hypothetical protein
MRLCQSRPPTQIAGTARTSSATPPKTHIHQRSPVSDFLGASGRCVRRIAESVAFRQPISSATIRPLQPGWRSGLNGGMPSATGFVPLRFTTRAVKLRERSFTLDGEAVVCGPDGIQSQSSCTVVAPDWLNVKKRERRSRSYGRSRRANNFTPGAQDRRPFLL